jgi:hypothetical protein
MDVNKINKLEVYELALELFKIKDKSFGYGFCAALTYSLMILYSNISKEDIISFISKGGIKFKDEWEESYNNIYDIVKDSLYGRTNTFIEIYKYRPTDWSTYWFDPEDSQSRIDILKRVISKLKE